MLREEARAWSALLATCDQLAPGDSTCALRLSTFDKLRVVPSEVEGRRSPLDYCGTTATILSGPPLPPRIFIGSATTKLPVRGSRSSCATFSNAGMFAAIRT